MLGTLPAGTYAVCLNNIDNMEYIESYGQWSRRDVTLVFYVTVPAAELARAYGITKNAVGLRLMRTREKLRNYLREAGYTVP